MATIVNRLAENVLRALPRILDAVFQCTLEMINKDLEEFPEHRTNFFTLLQAVNAHCFSALLTLTSDKFKLILDSVIWAIKHTMRQVSIHSFTSIHSPQHVIMNDFIRPPNYSLIIDFLLYRSPKLV